MQVDPTSPITLGSSPGSAIPIVPMKGQLEARAELTRTPERPDAEQIMAELSQAFAPFNIALKFSKDDETGTIVVQMIDQLSGETLQQIPTEASLQVAACLGKWQGRILNLRA